MSIGSSLDSHVKCVDAPRAVHCDSTAKQLGRTGKYPDTFHIYHEGDRRLGIFHGKTLENGMLVGIGDGIFMFHPILEYIYIHIVRMMQSLV